jgi:hypothetical protein
MRHKKSEKDYSKTWSCGDFTAYAGTVLMSPGADDSSRVVEFEIDAIFDNPPTSSLTIYSRDSPGPMFAIYNLTIVADGGLTVFKVEAENVQIGSKVKYDYFCDFIIIG